MTLPVCRACVCCSIVIAFWGYCRIVSLSVWVALDYSNYNQSHVAVVHGYLMWMESVRAVLEQTSRRDIVFPNVQSAFVAK